MYIPIRSNKGTLYHKQVRYQILGSWEVEISNLPLKNINRKWNYETICKCNFGTSWKDKNNLQYNKDHYHMSQLSTGCSDKDSNGIHVEKDMNLSSKSQRNFHYLTTLNNDNKSTKSWFMFWWEWTLNEKENNRKKVISCIPTEGAVWGMILKSGISFTWNALPKDEVCVNNWPKILNSFRMTSLSGDHHNKTKLKLDSGPIRFNVGYFVIKQKNQWINERMRDSRGRINNSQTLDSFFVFVLQHT